ncbi:SAM-dependent methyltransferase [Thermocatellispora tengchongensis]|uniref:SAM-dependent methyltransferase n=1 Tax=Thermocatellispora tengchongensis TaxID=1073253 RepID=A0A840P370_9ACTN|nr:class I SAM-dependent methyltransferase [Thermocatellispora tengchongensis]MBB5135734.1 SAM-dependent methyltransferase [Thermocatellispora tengchongensis]
MGIGRLLHARHGGQGREHGGHDRHKGHHGHAGGVIDHPRAYEIFSVLGYAGRRREVFARLATIAGLRAGHRVLDVGCGTGYLSRLISPAAGHDGGVTGVDPSPKMIEYARERAPANCEYIVGEGQALDLPDSAFDLVISTLAVHHIPEDGRAAAVREMFRVLRPGGRLLIAEYRPPSSRLGRLIAGALTGPAMRHDLRHDLIGWVTDAGFRIDATGDLRPSLTYVRAIKPAPAG